jgi:hypothetical protein
MREKGTRKSKYWEFGQVVKTGRWNNFKETLVSTAWRIKTGEETKFETKTRIQNMKFQDKLRRNHIIAQTEYKFVNFPGQVAELKERTKNIQMIV